MDYPEQKIFLDEKDLQLALASACASLGLAHYPARARFYAYSSLKSVAFVRGNEILLKASDAFRSASQDALLGLCAYLVAKLFRKRVPGQLQAYVEEYRRFTASKSGHSLHNSIRVLRSRSKLPQPKGSFYNLNEVVGKVAADFWELLHGIRDLPAPTWTPRGSARTLGEYDDAFNRISISRVLDDGRVPRFVLEYVVLHELLHAKHEALYSRGKSLRRVVHSTSFRQDEKKFPLHAQADAWLARNGRLLENLRIS